MSICCTYVYLLYLCVFVVLLCVFVVLLCVFAVLLCVFVVLLCVFVVLLCVFVVLMCIRFTLMCICCTYVYLLYYYVYLLYSYVYLFYYVCVDILTLDAGLLARSQYPEGPATDHLDTGFSCFPCVCKRMLRWFPSFQVATTNLSCSPPDLNFLVTFFLYLCTCKITTATG